MSEWPTCLALLLHHSVPPGHPVVSIMGRARSSTETGHELLQPPIPGGEELRAPASSPAPTTTTSGFPTVHKFIPAVCGTGSERERAMSIPRAWLQQGGTGEPPSPTSILLAGQNPCLYVSPYNLCHSWSWAKGLLTPPSAPDTRRVGRISFTTPGPGSELAFLYVPLNC